MGEETRFEARYRDYRKLGIFWQAVLAVLSFAVILSAAAYIFHIFGWTPIQSAYIYFLIGLSLPLVFLTYPISARSRKDVIPWYDVLLSLIALAIGLYFFTVAVPIINEGWEFEAPAPALGMAIAILIMLLEGARRTNGWVIFVLCLFFIFLPVFSSHMPGVLKGLQFDLDRVIANHVFGADSLIGPLGRVVGRLLIGYLLFAGVLQATGGGQFFLDVALCFLAKMRGAAAKVSVMASGVFGMLSGSVIANVMTTGAFTIPAMKRQGYARHYAAAVESCASTGGALAPPVMGAAAFIMSELTETPYLFICVAAAIPTILYYVILFTQADAYAGRRGIGGLPATEIPKLGPTLLKGWPYFLSIIVLIWFLAFERLEAHAPFWGIAALIIAAMFRKETRFSLRSFYDMVMASGRLIGDILVLLFLLGVVLGALALTGVATTMSFGLVDLAGPNIWLLPIFGAFAGYILGMGLPSSASYVLLAIAIAPAMVRAGFPLIPAHLFCAYCGILSYIIPPVALAAIAGAKMAEESSVMKTGLTAMRLGMGIFVLPFIWIFYPELLIVVGAETPISVTLVTFFLALVGLILISSSFERYFIKWRLSKLEWPLLALGGFLIVIPETLTDTIGGAIVVFLAAARIIRFLAARRKAAKTT